MLSVTIVYILLEIILLFLWYVLKEEDGEIWIF